MSLSRSLRIAAGVSLSLLILAGLTVNRSNKDLNGIEDETLLDLRVVEQILNELPEGSQPCDITRSAAQRMVKETTTPAGPAAAASLIKHAHESDCIDGRGAERQLGELKNEYLSRADRMKSRSWATKFTFLVFGNNFEIHAANIFLLTSSAEETADI